MRPNLSNGTREQLLDAAMHQFADKGFYGASIAGIAEEVRLTKQALLHHFGSKEKLYGELLQRISDQALADIIQVQADIAEPYRQLESLILNYYRSTMGNSASTQLLMRELLDNKRRAEHAGNWYLKPFLDALVAIARKIPRQPTLGDTRALTIIYQFLGAINYFAVSAPTLRQMYGRNSYDRMKARYPDELKRMMRVLLECPDRRPPTRTGP